MWTADERVQQFAERVVERLGGLVECVVLTGSHARGDARPDSDIDVWVFLAEVTDRALREVGAVVSAMEEGPEVNPQCLTFAEARCAGFRKGFSVLQLHLEGVVLHGALKLPEPTRAQVHEECLELAAFCLMSARHYVTVAEPDEALGRKLEPWLLKPLVWAIRHETFLRTGKYLKPTQDLLDAITEPDRRAIVTAYREFRLRRQAGPFMPLVHTAARVCGSLIAGDMGIPS